MARIALIDDDPVEALVIGGLLDHVDADHQLEAFQSVDAFIQSDDRNVDVILLDRRVPPHLDFATSLDALRASQFSGPIVMITAGAEEEADNAWRGPLHGPIDKGQLLTPDALSRLLKSVLTPA